MKVLVVCQHFYPENFRINDICFELVKKGHQVTVLTGLPNYPKGKVFPEYRYFRNRSQKIKGVTIKRCSLVGRRKSTFMMGVNYLWFAIFGSLKALFMKKDFDIIYVYQLSPITMVWPAIVVKRLKKIPLIIHCLDQWPISVTTGPISHKSIMYKFLYKISVWTYNKADRITISSKSFKKYFEEILHISSKDKGLDYYPSYAESDYENLKEEKNDDFDLLFAGNIGPAQSVETIIEAANILKKHKNIKFHIVGDGLSKEYCEKLSKQYKLENVKFYGFHNVSKMAQFYAKADATLITMVNNDVVNNTLPAKVQSYMASGKPIIGAISGEVKDVIIEADCGLCCESLDYEKLAALILEASKDRKKLKKWSKNSRSYYEKHFQKEDCINNLITLFKEEGFKNEAKN
jgi:glycosyltransferase involved in cell wall biosynthesis